MSVRLPATSGPVQGPKNKLQPQQSTVWSRRMNAVCVRRARKTYGRKSNQHVILDNLNMTVPKGCIYGLLGASGCGKTTLLSCIVGRRTLNSGEIWVLGGKPGTRGSGVPGPRIGYMPQDMALYGEFTIKETMLYFGWVNGMKTEEIEERSAFLFNLLQLPGPNRYVKELSGGQQRRVSMAATFLHQPELLILDEPTVGVDPIIRQSVWDHLVEITKEKTTTIIITTHYIDETKQATTIGLMRGGRFLAEDSPDEILRRYNTDSLEDAFLKLSILQNRGKRRRSSISSEIIAARAAAMPELESMGNTNDAFEDQSEISGEFGDNMSIANVPAVIKPDNADPLPPDEEVKFSWTDMFYLMKSHHMKALIWKNVLWIWRNLPMMLFIFGIPISQISLFCWSIGHDPIGLNLAVINHEVPYKTSCVYNSSCSFENMSCRYLNHFAELKHNLVSYSSPEEARYAVKRNWAWAYIDIPPNFSEMLELRVENGKDANDTVIDGSQINIQLDMSNQHIAYLLQRQIISTLRSFAKDMAVACSVPENLLDVPIRMNEPIYGPASPNFTDFAAPGVMLTIVFFIAVSLTAGTMMIERDEGILERCLVSGITGLEILSAHIVTQFFVMLSQAIVTTVMALYVFNISNEGDVLWITLMMVLSGICGMTYGFVLSSCCDTFRSASYLSVGSFLPFIMLCGIIWPVQGMNKILQMISFFLPLTLSTESLRSMLARGWDINHPAVYSGFVSMGVWIVIFLLISVLLIKFKKG